MLGFTSLLSICLRSTSLLLILFCLRVHYGWSRHELPPHLTAVSLRRSHPSTSCNPNHTLARAAVSCHPTSLSSVYVAPIHLHLVILNSHTLARAAMSCHPTSLPSVHVAPIHLHLVILTNHTLARAAMSCHPTSLPSVYVAPIHLHPVILTNHTLARAAMSCHSTSSFLDMSWRLMPSWPSCLTCICRAASSCASAVCSKDAMRVCS